MDDARLGVQNAVGCHHGNGGALGVGEDLRLAVFDVVVGTLGVQINAEPAGGIHAAHLLVEVQVNFFVDDLQGASDGHDRAVCLQHAAMIDGRCWALLSLLRAVVRSSPRSLGQ